MAERSVRDVVSKISKLEKFDSFSFRRWKAKMFFYMMTLKIGYVLERDAPVEVEGETVAQMRERQKWEQDDFMCKGHILNAMSNSLYDVYEPTSANKTARELWTELENKYKTEDAENKRFLVSKLYDFRMVDTQSVLVQIHDFQVLLHQIIFEGHTLDEAFQVSSIIAKLNSTWKNTHKEFTQKKEPLDLQELIKFLQIEENTRNMEKIEIDKKILKVMVVENKSQNNGKKRKRDGNNNSGNGKKPKIIKSNFWGSGKPGHLKKDCKEKSKQKHNNMYKPTS